MIGGFQPLAFQPAYQQTGAVATSTSTARGAPHHRAPRQFSAEINGKFYYFDNLSELQAVLSSFKTKQKMKIAKKVERRIIPVSIPRVEPPVHVPMWAVQEIQKTNASMEAYFWAAYQRLHDQDAEDDDDAMIALNG